MQPILRTLRALPLLLLLFAGAPAERRAATTTPEAQGIDSEQLAQAIEAARGRGPGIHSLLVVRNGALVTEAYFHPYDGASPHDLASVTKSITTTLAGIAISQGKIKSEREPMLSFFPGQPIANRDARKESIRLDHLMTMSSGLDCKAQGGEPTLWEMLSAPDHVRHMLDLPMVAEPGANFVYCSGGMHLLSAIVGKAAGKSTEAFARQAMFEPLGIRRLIWPADAQGVSQGFGNLHLLPRDLARYGELILNRGKWNGKQLVPADWIDRATRMQKTTGNARDYGYGWWVPKPGGLVTVEASGRGGQQISLVPSKNAVIVFNGGGGFSTGDVLKAVLAAIKSDGPLPANPAGVAHLKAAIAAAAAPPKAVAPAPLSDTARAVSGKTFKLGPNWMGLRELTLTFASESKATARFVFGPSLKQYQFARAARIQGDRTLTETRPIGLDGIPVLSGAGPMDLPVALTGVWQDARTFVLEYDELANVNCYRLQIQFENDGLRIQAKERTGLFNETITGK